MTNTRALRAAVLAFLVAASLALAGFGVIAASAPASAGDHPSLLPDVVIRPITEIRIHKRVGVKLLRFATFIGNGGAGVVELKPDSPASSADNDCDDDGDPLNDRKAFQRVFRDADGNGSFTRGVDTVFDDRLAGCSVFHPAHNHWHFEEFARYRLVKPKTQAVVAASEKVSFCVRDSTRFDATLPGSPPWPGHYGNCTQDSVTGLSIGWADYYGSDLPGQELDIRGLPDGRYCLRNEADPSDRLQESDEGNNGRSTLVRIRGREVTNLLEAC